MYVRVNLFHVTFWRRALQLNALLCCFTRKNEVIACDISGGVLFILYTPLP